MLSAKVSLANPGMQVNIHLLHALDLASLHETAELGDGLPFLLLCQLSISCNLPL